MNESAENLAPELLPSFVPGYQFSHRAAWIDRFVIRNSTNMVQANSPATLRSWLADIAAKNPGIVLHTPKDMLFLEMSKTHWLFSGKIAFKRPLSELDRYSVSVTLNLNLMRYAAHTRMRQEGIRPPPNLRAKPIAEVDGLGRLRQLHRLKANSLNASDNYFGRASDFELFGKSATATLRQYLSAVERTLGDIMKPSNGVMFNFTLGGWSLSQIEVFWEFEEADAIKKSQKIGDQLARYSRESTRKTYSLRPHHAEWNTQRSNSTSIPLLDRKKVELVCYPKTRKRLRTEVRYESTPRGVRPKEWKTANFPNETLDQLPEFVAGIIEDASRRINDQFGAAFSALEFEERDTVALIAEAIGAISHAFAKDKRLLPLIISEVFERGMIVETRLIDRPKFNSLIRAEVLKRYKPRARNRETSYVLTTRYRGAFDLARGALSGSDNQSN